MSEPTTPQLGWLLKLRNLGRVSERYAGYRAATIKACEKRGWCVFKDQSWRLTEAGQQAIVALAYS